MSEPADPDLPKTPSRSATVLSQQMDVADANLSGNVHGGAIMRLVAVTPE